MGWILSGAEIEPANQIHIGATLLKQDTFGSVLLDDQASPPMVVRDTRTAPWWARWLARRLAAREARALGLLGGIGGVPRLYDFDGQVLRRQWLAGQPMYISRPVDPTYYRRALRLVAQLHRRGIAHNDLAKEPNWLVLEDGNPGLVDFQLASYSAKRGRWFRTKAREDLRHLLKHKRYYLAEHLSTRQRRILATPAWPSRVWRRTVKPIYLFVTRRLLHWADREGAEDRGRPGAV